MGKNFQEHIIPPVVISTYRCAVIVHNVSYPVMVVLQEQCMIISVWGNEISKNNSMIDLSMGKFRKALAYL